MTISQLNKDLLKFRTYGEIISQASGDMGDSLQRTSTYHSIMKLLNESIADRDIPIEESYKKDMDQLEPIPGWFRRSPDPNYWGSSVHNCSRDQLSQARITMGLYGDKERLWRSVKAQTKRFGFHQNKHGNYVMEKDCISWKDAIAHSIKLWSAGMMEDLKSFWQMDARPRVPDISTPGEIGTIIRGMGWWWLYPVLCIVDIFLLLENNIIKSNAWDSANMSCMVMIYANHKYPTPFSKLAWRNLDKEMCKAQIRHYYSDGIPPLGEMYCELIDRKS